MSARPSGQPGRRASAGGAGAVDEPVDALLGVDGVVLVVDRNSGTGGRGQLVGVDPATGTRTAPRLVSR